MYKFILIQQISDNLTKRMDMFKSDIDLINETLNGQLSDLKRKMMEEMNKSSGNLIKNFEESIKRLENHEKNTQTSLNGLALYKIDNETRLNELETNIHMEIKEIRKETSNHSIILENMENKINDNILNMNRDIGELMRDVNIIKVEMETMKNFKDNTVLNFKDIGDEFLKNEELYKKTSYRINLQIRDFEAKILTFEQTFNLHNENFVNIKKDIYSQIYDANLNINNKFQIFNDSLNQKLDSYDRVINDFQSNLMVL